MAGCGGRQRINGDGHLLRMFSMVLAAVYGDIDALRAAVAAAPGGVLPAAALGAGGAMGWLAPCVAVLERAFSWDFSDSDARGGVVGAFKSGRADVVAPGPAWRDALVRRPPPNLAPPLVRPCCPPPWPGSV